MAHQLSPYSSAVLLLVVQYLQFSNGIAASEVGLYLISKGSMYMNLTNFGARIASLVLPDKHGNLGDIVLGFDTAREYTNSSANFGATIGRVANRISGAQFVLNGTVHKLQSNGQNVTVHGGPRGFARVVWSVTYHSSSCIVFAYHSPDGDQGFPGALNVRVKYELLRRYRLRITMNATAGDKTTPVNLAHHSFFNLNGQNSGDILSETVKIFASHYTPVDAKLIPTGKIVSVRGTPYDFLEGRPISSKIKKLPGGYDINYVLDGPENDGLKLAAIVSDAHSGRSMKVMTNQPGVQFFTSNKLNTTGKGGFLYKPFAALCLETQGFPDAVNRPNFPSQFVNPRQVYNHRMLFEFSLLK